MEDRPNGSNNGADINDEIWVHRFDEESAKKFREGIQKQVRMFEDPKRPIIIYIDSYGGYSDSLSSMIETMDSVENPLITVCCGKAMSAGALLLAHGDIRYCGQHSRIMVHEVSAGTEGDVHNVANDAEELKRLNTHFMGMLAIDCGIKGGYKGIRQIIKDHDGRELWLDAESAQKFGIIDYVGMPIVATDITYRFGVHKREARERSPLPSQGPAPKKPAQKKKSRDKKKK